MLSPARENLLGKLLLSSALVAVSLGYGVWQRHHVMRPAIAVAPKLSQNPMPSAPKTLAPAKMAASAPVTLAQPDSAAPPDTSNVSKDAKAAPKSTVIAGAMPQTNAPVPAPQAPPQQDAVLPAAPPPPDVQPAQPMVSPADDVSPTIPPATGTPPAGLVPVTTNGTHLQDGDYVSDKHQLEWGDLRVKISVHGEQITGVQILQYPDHRSRSFDLSLMAGPILESEVIKAQSYQVDAVSSATDTSYAFQDTIADAIVKATRE